MSDQADEPTPADAPGKPSIWQRYRDASTWIKVAIPVAAVVILVGVGALIASAVRDDSSSVAGPDDTTTTTSPGNTAILLLVATQLASDETSTTTTLPPETIPETIPAETTAAEPTTAESVAVETTTPTTEAPPTTTPPTEAPATTAPPTTAATTQPVTEPPTTEPTTKPATTTTEPTTTTSTIATTVAPTTSVVVLPPGQIASSPQAFQAAWNTAAAGAGVAPISTWTQKPLAGNTGDIANLGGNLRLVLLSDGANTPVSAAVLAWLPLTDPATQAQQNESFQKAFAVLTETVDAAVTEEQQTTLSAQLGLGPTAPPFAAGASASASLAAQQYALRGLVPSGQSGVYSLVGVSALA